MMDVTGRSPELRKYIKYQALATVLVLASLCSAQKIFRFGSEVADVSLTDVDFDRGYTTVELTTPFSVYGRAEFEKVYINVVGAVSIGEPVITQSLEDIRNNVIIFSPFLVSSTGNAFSNRTIFYRVSQNQKELEDLQRLFRNYIADVLFSPTLAVIVTFDFFIATGGTMNEPNYQRNHFQFIFVSDGDKTFIRYFYKYLQYIQHDGEYAKVGQFVFAESALTCLDEVKGSGTSDVGNLFRHSNTGSRGNYFWRIDLPLRCSNFKSDCSKAEEPIQSFNLSPVGYFIETVSRDMWRFYRLYFCKAGTKTTAGDISFKQDCSYDSDYYMYEWKSLTSSNQCNESTNDKTMEMSYRNCFKNKSIGNHP